MKLLLTFILLVCAGFLQVEAGPVVSRRRRQLSGSDALIIMPGVSPRRVVDEVPELSSDPLPMLFGGRFAFESPNPISFGNQDQKGLPVETEDTTELLPLIRDEGLETLSFDIGSGGVPNAVNFPGNKPTDQKPTTAPVVVDDGSGDNVFFPSHIRVNVKSEGDADGTEVILSSMDTCGSESGGTLVNGTCMSFLSRNSCPDGEWFVMDTQTNVPECVPRPCPFGQLMFKGTCVNVEDGGVCGEGQMLYVDFTGYVHCDCMPHFFYDPWSGKCYAQGEQGNCNFGQRLYINDTGFVDCQPNPCLMDGYIFHNETRGCYRKQYYGFCTNDVIVHANNQTAECPDVVTAHTLFDLPTRRSCVGGSRRDYSGNCRAAFRVPTASSFPKLYGTCPGSFVQDARGTCRKTQRLFG